MNAGRPRERRTAPAPGGGGPGPGRGRRARPRFRLLAARLLAAEGHVGAARRVFEDGFEVPDLREGEETLSEVWAALTDRPLPPEYDFRMRPPA
ncbi:hypothetical protein ACFVHW_18405 [Streptomyces sp. NPDC127110]|uniref:hypothetical protein n=1 Tax=Streptomyces sp. NPDC127110 TaxID=3345362 RepID=UPI0036444711